MNGLDAESHLVEHVVATFVSEWGLCPHILEKHLQLHLLSAVDQNGFPEISFLVLYMAPTCQVFHA